MQRGISVIETTDEEAVDEQKIVECLSPESKQKIYKMIKRKHDQTGGGQDGSLTKLELKLL